jgi:hypothetical protein
MTAAGMTAALDEVQAKLAGAWLISRQVVTIQRRDPAA